MTEITLKASDFIQKIKADLDRKIIMIGGFFFLVVFLRVGLKTPLPDQMFFLFIVLILGAGLLMYIFRRLSEKDPGKVIKIYFSYNLFEIVLITIFIYYTGGITWIAPIFYSLPVITAFWIYPRNLAVLVLSCANVLLVSLIILQFLGILPGIFVFRPEAQNYHNFSYVFSTTIIASAVLFLIGFLNNAFYTLLVSQVRELKRSREKLEDIKDSLVAEVQKRTEEIEREKMKLEEEVQKRTRELEGGRKIVKEKVKELERLHENAVAKELKMIKLKSQISKLKKPRTSL